MKQSAESESPGAPDVDQVKQVILALTRDLAALLEEMKTMAAVGLGLLALWFLLLPQVGPAGAALIPAAVLAVLCLILLALAGMPGHAAAIGKFRIEA